MIGPWLLGLVRDCILFLGSVMVAEIAAPGFQQPVATIFVEWASDLALYVGLAVFATVARGFFDARDGRIPDRNMLRRAVIVAAFVGVVGGVLVAERSWSPGMKMATISLCSFFLDWSIPAISKAWRAWLARLISPPDNGSPPLGGGGA